MTTVVDIPRFEDFYRAANTDPLRNAGRPPFPWQSRLAARLARGEGWPQEIGVPTGLGKTSCIDVAVWWLACEADREPGDRTAPTRIWWLVNRRLLVDSTTEHAERLRLLLADPEHASSHASRTYEPRESEALTWVADRLRGLSARPDAPPLEVVRLRGGVAAARPTDPSQPAIVLSTIPMYGSRLLFRGYGVSRSMRPVDAALAGTDSLVLVDEAHLAHHLMKLFEPLAECDVAEAPVLPAGRARPRVVSLTATGAATADRFDLDADDRANDVVSRRLRASKLLTIDEHPPGSDVAGHLATACRELLAERPSPASCIVFTNTPAVARETHRALVKLVERKVLDGDVLLLTGRARERESRLTREWILDPHTGAPANRSAATPRDQHFVVATQTLEVGADLDFDLLVTEACGVRALTQRLGRLNRLGSLPAAAARYVHVPPKSRQGESLGWAVYGEEPIGVLERLRQRLVDGMVDLCPELVADVLGPPGDDPGRSPEVLPALLAEWTKTSQPPAGEAAVEPFFSGLTRPELVVSLAWRAHLPDEGGALWPRIHDDELIELPLGEEVRDALERVGEVRRLREDRASVELVAPGDLRPGDTVLVSTSAGLLDEYGWNPTSQAAVVDVSVLRDGLPLDAEAIRRIAGTAGTAVGELVKAIVEPADDDDIPVEERVEELLGLLADAEPAGVPAGEWSEFLGTLSHRPESPSGEVPRLRRGHTRDPLVDAHDEISLLSRSAVELGAHGDGVGSRAETVARRIGVSADLVALLGRAGRFHDVGKADERFQQWLDPRGEAAGLVAKSTRPRGLWGRDRIAAAWPEGGRHEALSGRLVLAWAEAADDAPQGPLADLLVHLVVAHHGWGRPLLYPVRDGLAGEVAFELDGLAVKASADLARVDWEQPARFRELGARHGHWGLALLETIVRQADHAVSAGGWAGETEVV